MSVAITWLPLVAGIAALGVMVVRSLRLRRAGVNPWALTGDDDARGFLGRVFVSLSVAYGILLVWNVLDPALPLAPAWIGWFGLALIGSGLGLVVWAQRTMGLSWRLGIPETEKTIVVTRGPFRVSRNLVFFAMLVAAPRIALVVPITMAWALLGAAYVATRQLSRPSSAIAPWQSRGAETARRRHALAYRRPLASIRDWFTPTYAHICRHLY